LCIARICRGTWSRRAGKTKGKRKENEKPRAATKLRQIIARLGINQNGKDWLGKPGVPNY
jgi:hypothetical protein